MKVEIFRDYHNHRFETQINEWLSSKNVEIKHIVQSSTIGYENGYTTGKTRVETIISIFYEDSE